MILHNIGMIYDLLGENEYLSLEFYEKAFLVYNKCFQEKKIYDSDYLNLCIIGGKNYIKIKKYDNAKKFIIKGFEVANSKNSEFEKEIGNKKNELVELLKLTEETKLIIKKEKKIGKIKQKPKCEIF